MQVPPAQPPPKGRKGRAERLANKLKENLRRRKEPAAPAHGALATGDENTDTTTAEGEKKPS